MKLKSMRVRLPLTYAAIALLTALALGGVLYISLKGYYAKQERFYLTNQAAAIQPVLSKMIESGAPPKALEAQVSSLAFFTQAHVRLLDNQNRILADSGDPTKGDIFSVLPLTTSVNVKAGAVGILQSQSSQAVQVGGNGPALEVNQNKTQDGYQKELTAPISGTVQTNGANILFLFRSTGIGAAQAASQPWIPPDIRPNASVGQVEARPVASQPMTDTLVMLSAVPKKVAFSSYDLISNGLDKSQPSNQVVIMAIQDPEGKIAGIVELSGGPSFGGAILHSVTQATLVASLIAILLAAIVGWLVSRQVTQPLTVLTQVTRNMADGYLSARANPGATGELGELGASFNRMAERIEGTVGALRKFASDAAHELKTPLTALVTELELSLEDGISPQEREEYLQRAQGQARRLDHLMDGLLDLSRLESGPQEDPPIPVDLTGLLREAGENFAAQVEQHDLEFDLVLPDAPLSVMGYPDQLRRAAANLVENAVKFTPPGGRVQLWLGAVEGEVEVHVADSGIGIPQEDLDQVFRRFHRGHNASAYNGSGLGLAIVQAIVQAHGGRVWAENNPDGGVCFTIRLPGTFSEG